jgi:VCBS repeat-containing protein
VTYSIGTQPGKGTVTLTPDGIYTYTPDPAKQHAAAADTATAADKTDSFTIETSDGYGGMSRTTVSVRIAATNVGPVLAPLITVFETPKILTRDDGRGNTSSVYTDVFLIDPRASDADGDALKITVSSSNPDKVDLLARPDGTYLYIPAAFTRYDNGIYTYDSAADSGSFTDQVTIWVDDGHGGAALYKRTDVDVVYLGELTAVYEPPTIALSGLGSNYIDVSGNSVPISVVNISGTPLQIGYDSTQSQLVVGSGFSIDPSGALVISSPTSSPTTPIVVSGCVGGDSTSTCGSWNIVTTNNSSGNTQAVNIYAESSLQTAFYLGKA